MKEENRILRARLPERLVATPQERRRLLRAGRRLGVQLKELISIVSYQTFRRWIREAEENHTKRTLASLAQQKPEVTLITRRCCCALLTIVQKLH